MDFGFQFFLHGCRNDHSLSSEDDNVLYCEFISVVKVRGDAERDFAFSLGHPLMMVSMSSVSM